MRILTLLIAALLGAAPIVAIAQQAAIEPVARAHAHNDYRHPRPLLDAVARGFCSVEADIFLVDGKLLVGHDRDELDPARTLVSLYLDPLRELARRNGGRIYRDGPTVTLLVDIKENGAEVYAVLRQLLESYKDILCGVEEGEYVSRAVQIVISGDRPIKEITNDTTRFVGIDGRLGDLDSSAPADLIPLISDRWTSHFSWRGIGDFPEQERHKLQSIVNRAHAAGRRVRFWATPEEELLWSELLAAGVDHINTDQLNRLRDFLRAQ